MTTILVVDDEPDIRMGIRLHLLRAGFDVVEASGGEECLLQIASSTPDLVLLDVMMPRMDGWETLERIRATTTLPVLMLTARGLQQDRERGVRSGAQAYLSKPFDSANLLLEIRTLLAEVDQ